MINRIEGADARAWKAMNATKAVDYSQQDAYDKRITTAAIKCRLIK